MRMSYVLLAVLVLGCGGGGGDSGYTTGPSTGGNNNPPSGGTASGTASVSMSSSDDGYGYQTFSFSPSSVTITKGGTVTWNNTGSTVHNVTFTTAGAPSGIGNFSSGSNSRTFPTAGTYSYQCTNHAGMQGTVTVQ